MKQWWRGLQQRERVIVLVALLLLTMIVLHGLVWQPWQRAGEALVEDVEQARDDLEWMRQAAGRLSGAAPSVRAAASGGNLVTRMNRLIGQSGLRSRMKQMKPNGDQEVRLRFEKAAFDSLLGLLRDVERQGLEIRELRVLPIDQPGRVNATLVVRSGG